MVFSKIGIVCGVLLAFQMSSCDERRAPAPPQNPTPPHTPRPMPPPPPQVNPIQITGTERLTWDQPVHQGFDIKAHQFFIYVDGQRQPLNEASCGQPEGPAGFPCSTPLPPLSAGRHNLQLQASHVVNGVRRDSFVSGNILVFKVEGTGTLPASTASESVAANAGDPAATVEVLSDRVAPVADLAVAPDGRFFVAERKGQVLAGRDGSIDPQPVLEIHDAVTKNGLGLFSIALHPDFEAKRFVYLIYAADSRDGPVYRIGRGREVGGRIGEVAPLLTVGPVAAGGWAVLRFGPDGKLYVGLRSGFAGDANSRNPEDGQILRLNEDGTTPNDNPGASPTIASGHRGLSGLAFGSGGHLIARASKEAAAEVAWYQGPIPVPFRRGTGIVLSIDGAAGGIAHETRSAGGLPNRVLVGRLDGGVELVAARTQGEAQGRRVRVAQEYGAVRAVAVAADGTIYAATANADQSPPSSIARDYVLRIRAPRP